MPSMQESYRDNEELKQENKILSEKLESLSTNLRLLEDAQKENEEYRKALSLRPSPKFELIFTEVLFRHPSTWRKNFSINKGQKDYIEIGSPVLSKGNLIGLISKNSSKIDKETSLVDTIMHPNIKISSLIKEAKVTAILNGACSGPDSQKAYCKLSFIPRDSEIKAGFTVVSSGLNPLIPKGLKIGKIVESTKNEIYQDAIVELNSDFRELQLLSVLLEKE